MRFFPQNCHFASHYFFPLLGSVALDKKFNLEIIEIDFLKKKKFHLAVVSSQVSYIVATEIEI